MLRRTVSLLLVPIVLLAQLAAVGHSHSDGCKAEHAAQTHLHIKFADHRADAQHRHSHPHSDAMFIGQDSNALDEVSLRSLPQHDDDAVYLAVNEVMYERGSSCDAHISPAGLTLAIATLFNGQPTELGVYAFRPPPEDRLGPCPIYIRHLTLLI